MYYPVDFTAVGPMQIEDFKAWQWALVGAVFGLLFSCSIVVVGPWFDNDQLDTIDSTALSQALLGRPDVKASPAQLRKYHADQPVIRNLVVHPPFKGDSAPDRYWLTGQVYWIGQKLKDPKNPAGGAVLAEQWRPFKLAAPAPYVVKEPDLKKNPNAPPAVAPGTYPTIREYLAAAKQSLANKPTAATFPSHRFAWQELPAAVWSLPAAAGVLIVGIAWPTTLAAMQSIGMARPPRKPKAKPVPKPAAQPVPSTAGVRVVLPPSTVKTPDPAPHVDDKEYKGEFYPVVKNTH